MPPKKKKNSNSTPAPAKSSFTPTPPVAQASSSSGISYLSALAKKSDAPKEEKQQQQQQPSKPVSQTQNPWGLQQKPWASQQGEKSPESQQKQEKQLASQQTPLSSQQKQFSSQQKQEKQLTSQEKQLSSQQKPKVEVVVPAPQEQTPPTISYKSILQKPAPVPAPAPTPAPTKEKLSVSTVARGAEMSAAKSPTADEASSVQPPAAVAAAAKKVRPEKQKYKSSEKLTIPQGAAAYIIGKAGANVKRINETSGAFVMVKDTHVSIQANTREHMGNARKQVLELLRSYMSRVSTQAREFNVYMHDDIDVENMNVVMKTHNGPFSEWTIRDALGKEPVHQQRQQKKGPETKTVDGEPKVIEVSGQESESQKQENESTKQETVQQEEEGIAKQEVAPEETAKQEDEKPVFYTPIFTVVSQQEQEDKDEEEEELERFVQYTAAKKEMHERRESSERQLQGASFNFISKPLLKDMFGLITDKLVEEKEREEQFRQSHTLEIEEEEESHKTPEEIAKSIAEKKKEYHRNSADAEVIIGKKLFFINPEKKKKKKDIDIKVEDEPLAKFKDNRFGYSHKYHMTFNSALNVEDVKKIEDALMEREDIQISKRQILSCRTYIENHKKANILLEVEPSESNLASVKIVDFYEKSQRIAFVDFVRPILDGLDYRIISKYYSHIDAPAKLIENVANKVCFDKAKNDLVITEEQQEPEALEKKKTDSNKKERFNLILDRIKNETIYTDGEFTVFVSSVRDKVQKFEEEKKELAVGEGEPREPQHDKYLETVEIVARCAGLGYEGIEYEKQVTGDIYSTMGWVSSLLESVGL